MTVKEKIQKEISQLSKHELMKLHDIITFIHKDRKLPNEVYGRTPPYLKVREALKDVGNLSDIIISERTETL